MDTTLLFPKRHLCTIIAASDAINENIADQMWVFQFLDNLNVIQLDIQELVD